MLLLLLLLLLVVDDDDDDLVDDIVVEFVVFADTNSFNTSRANGNVSCRL